jgi:hypothetical protein
VNAREGQTAERRGHASKYEVLLRWVSECGTGTWLGFRDAHDWLFNIGQQEGQQVRATTTIHALSMLGHIEINWDSGRWVVAPSALTILPNAGAHAVVTGARTHRMLGEFEQAAADSDYFAESHRQDWGPDALFVAASDEGAIEALAAKLGVNYEVCVSERLAEMLPSLESYLALSKSTPAARGYGVERFNVRFLNWERVQKDGEAGLYRYDVWGRPEYRFVSDDGMFYSVDWSLGVHAEVARSRRREIHYKPDSVNGTLRVPFAAQLPALQARTAALCTGLMPRLQDRKWQYANVPRATAEAIASSLGQALVVDDRGREN